MIRALLALLLRRFLRSEPAWRDQEEPESLRLYPCWFCRTPVPVSFLIAGYDTFEEQRLACLDCDAQMQGAA